jgi:hypothetical protein
LEIIYTVIAKISRTVDLHQSVHLKTTGQYANYC